MDVDPESGSEVVHWIMKFPVCEYMCIDLCAYTCLNAQTDISSLV